VLVEPRRQGEAVRERLEGEALGHALTASSSA
jgi:hypothetical protein